jgi:hypothetical protein
MGDCTTEGLRWGREEQESIAEYLQFGKIDFSRLNSAEYLRNVQRQKPIWERHPPKNFNQNIQRVASAFQADQGLSGAHRNNSPYPDSDDEMEEVEKEKDDEEEHCEFLLPSLCTFCHCCSWLLTFTLPFSLQRC